MLFKAIRDDCESKKNESGTCRLVGGTGGACRESPIFL